MYIEPQQETTLYADVCQIIDGARSRIAIYVNTEACLTNWYVGKRIKEDVLYSKRAEYGKQVVINLSIKQTERYGSGWSEKTLRHCLRTAEIFSEDVIRKYLMLDAECPIKVAQYYTKLTEKQ
jgi:phosphoribosylformimino-5-aminoimidazole carboxamide ribonucleotide (ProFAR) isomerase